MSNHIGHQIKHFFQPELSSMKGDVKDAKNKIKSEFSHVKGDVQDAAGHVKSGLLHVKDDFDQLGNKIKSELPHIKSELSHINSELSQLEHALPHLNTSHIKEVFSDFSKLLENKLHLHKHHTNESKGAEQRPGVDPATSATNFSAVSTSGWTSSSALDLLARLMVEQAGQQRKSALDDRLAARNEAKSELLGQADKTREAADKMKSGALQSLITTVVVAAVQIASSAIGMGAGMKSISQKSAAFAEGGAEAAKMAGGKAGMIAEAAGAAEKISGAVGQGTSHYLSASAEADAKNKEAAGQEHAALAQQIQASGDIRKEQQEALDQMVKAVIQFLKDMQDAKAQQMQTLTRV